MYNYYKDDLKTYHTILIENGVHKAKNNNIVQGPVALYLKNNKHFITINVRDYFTLLYEIQFKNLLNLKKTIQKK